MTKPNLRRFWTLSLLCVFVLAMAKVASWSEMRDLKARLTVLEEIVEEIQAERRGHALETNPHPEALARD